MPRERIVPFLTSKHSLEYCLSYADRAHQNGFPALVVLGGDKTVGAPRSVEHAWQLREMLRERDHALALGGWANPHADPERQVDYLAATNVNAEFYLTQVVSHHHADAVARFVAHRRAARPDDSRALRRLLLPQRQPADAGRAQGLSAGAGRGADARVRRRRHAPKTSARRTIRTLMDIGARHFYISNLPVPRAQHVLAGILEKVGVTA